MSEPRILREDRDHVVVLTLNRPDKLNALDTTAFDELGAHLDILEKLTTSCLVIRGRGRAFCAGADLATASTAAADVPIAKSHLLTRMSELPFPVIAAVHGHCIGGGLELALAADLIVAEETASFADAHARWGLVPAWGLSQRLPRRIGQAGAKYMMFSGRAINTAEAHRLGLVDLVAEEGHLDEVVDALVDDITSRSGFSHREVKRLVDQAHDVPLLHGLAQEHYRAVRHDPERDGIGSA